MTAPRTDPQSTVPVEPLSAAFRKADLDNFNQWAARWMRRRLDDGERKFGPQSWRDSDYTDNQNAARLVRAVEHLFVVLRHWRNPDEAQFTDATELGKRAADVANQAFMLADQQRQEGDEPFTFTLDAARASQPITAGAREATCPHCGGQPMSPDCGVCGGAGTLPILDLAALSVREDEPTGIDVIDAATVQDVVEAVRHAAALASAAGVYITEQQLLEIVARLASHVR